MLESFCRENFDSCRGAGHYPGSKDEDLVDWFLEIGWQLELLHFFSSLEDPKSLSLPMGRVSPSRIYLFLPGITGGNVGWGLRSGHEDEIETAAQIICLKSFSDGSCDLKRRLAEGNRCERHAGGGNQSNSLKSGPELAMLVLGILCQRWKRTLNGAKIREGFVPSSAVVATDETFWRLASGPSDLECGIVGYHDERIRIFAASRCMGFELVSLHLSPKTLGGETTERNSAGRTPPQANVKFSRYLMYIPLRTTVRSMYMPYVHKR